MADQEDEEVMMTWATQSFGLDNRLIKACKKAGWVAPTLVQSHAIPVIMRGKDVLCRAKTGAGKTAAYLLPLLHKILSTSQTKQQGVKALILVPTNELCLQVEKQIKELTYYCAEEILCLSLATNAKGTSKSSKSALMKTQAVMLQTCPDIVVATPARAQPHLTAKHLTLVPSVFQTFVVDEADLVLSFGHSQDMRSIAAYLPGGGKNQSGGGCQGILMSATLSTQLQDLKKLVLHSPATIRLQDAKSNNNTNKLIQFYIALDPEDKYLLLYVFIRLGLLQGKGLIFVNDIDGAYKLRLFLAKFSIRAAALNSQLPLTSRTHMLDEFNRGVFDLLIATDEGLTANLRHESDSESSDDSSSEEDDDNDSAEKAEEHSTPSKPEAKSGKRKRKAETVDPDDEYGVVRGVDFRGVNFVVNLDMPNTSEAYTHRIGRTARAGAQGTALSLVSTKDSSEWDLLAKIQSEQPALPAMSGQSVLAAIGPATQQEDPSATHSNAQLPQPSLLAFDLREVDGFRYRVEDVYISISRAMVREERTSELKREILRCNELQDYFAKNPNELKTLRHDTSALPSQFVPESLAHVPEYLLPNSLKVIGGDTSKAPGRKKRRKLPPGQRKRANDPLQTFVDPAAQPAGEKLYRRSDDKIKSTAGRQLWKLRHSKGAFSKKRKTQKPQPKKGRKK